MQGAASPVKTMDHEELLWDPGALVEALDVADMAAQGAVHGGAVSADEDSSADGGPGGAGGAAVSTDWGQGSAGED